VRIEELNSAFRLSRQEGRRAQDTANHALDGLRQLEGRVAELDDFRVASMWTVRFGFNSSELSDEGRLILDGIVENTPPESTLFEVTGFTSADGDPAYNLRLSEKRAQQVVRYLVEELQIPLHRILIPFGFGSGKPEADNDTMEGRQLNRRVEVRALTNQHLDQTVAAR
jgi:outer membrane protein OmpA-like peptidoglycan-associated protein